MIKETTKCSGDDGSDAGCEDGAHVMMTVVGMIVRLKKGDYLYVCVEIVMKMVLMFVRSGKDQYRRKGLRREELKSENREEKFRIGK